MTAEQILARLEEISRQIEAHRAAAYMLDFERVELHAELRRSGWKPPEVPKQ